MDPGVDKLLIYTIFLLRELFGLKVKARCTSAVIWDGQYIQEIKTTVKSREANQADYVDVWFSFS